MPEIQDLLKNVEKKEFTDFSNNFKTVMQEKIQAHPRMQQHNKTMDMYAKQKEIYSQVATLVNPPQEASE